MAVKPGYKQTEVGVIPEDWDDPRLDSLGGARIPPIKAGPFGSSLTKDQYVPEGFKVYGQEQVIAGDHLFGDYFITQKKYRELESCGVRPGDVLLSLVGTVGRLLEVPEGAPPGVINPRLIRFSFDRELVSSRFFKYVFESGRVQSLLARYAQGGTMGVLNAGVLRPFRIPLPPLPEQRAIAEALGDVDALLGALDRLIAKKRDLKQAAMQQLLTGQTRLPGFHAGSKFKQTDVGRIPEDWGLVELVTLVDPSRSIRYGIVQPGDYDPQGRYMVRGQDYSEVKGWASPIQVFRVSPRIEERYRNARVKTGDLIMTIVGYCGHVEIIPEWLDGANLTQTTARIAIQPDKAVSAFCRYMLLSQTGMNQVAAYMKGAAQPGLNCGDVEQFLVPLPPLPEQAAIAEVLTDMDAELAALEQRREKTRALKQAMMQELLTGRTRLV